jgi:hypothetical protein
VREVSGYNRHELRAVLDELPFYCDRAAKARVAREFTQQDLIILTVVRELEVTHGMRRNAVAGIFAPLRAALSGPKKLNPQARLHITVSPPRVKYIEIPTVLDGGTTVPLGSIFERVDGYLGLHLYVDNTSDQRSLRLGPTVIAGRKKRLSV